MERRQWWNNGVYRWIENDRKWDAIQRGYREWGNKLFRMDISIKAIVK